MLVILHQDGCEGIAAHAEADISTAFSDHVEVQTVAANDPPAWSGDPSWDDLLVILRSGPRNLDSGLSEIFIVFQAAVPKLVASKYTTSGVRRPSAL